MNSKSIQAIAVFIGDIKGYVTFTEENDKIRIDLNISGLKSNSNVSSNDHSLSTDVSATDGVASATCDNKPDHSFFSSFHDERSPMASVGES